MLMNLCKAAVASVVAPVLAVADLATLPASAYEGRHPFHRTRASLRTAGKALDAAIEAERFPKRDHAVETLPGSMPKDAT